MGGCKPCLDATPDKNPNVLKQPAILALFIVSIGGIYTL
jgi:hypothetical protein